MHNRLALMLAVFGLAALVSAPTSFAAWQDTHICDVPSADFSTIQSAIDQPLCFTVRLAVATFKEQLTIHRTLTLAGRTFQQGDEVFMSRLRPPDSMTDAALIRVVGARTRAKIKHVTIEGPGGGDGFIGVWAGRDTRVAIRDCVFRDMRPPTLDARWGFFGMWLGGQLMPKTKVGISAHSITNCRFDGYQTVAIAVSGVGTTATISHNIIDAAGGTSVPRPSSATAPIGVIASDGASVVIDRNTIRNNYRDGGGGAAILLHGSGANSVVSSNNIDGNWLGVGLDGMSGAEVQRNHLTDNDVGMWLGWTAPADSNAILLNRIGSGGTGLLLDRANSNRLSSNNLQGNLYGDGARVSAASTNNEFDGNRSDNNGGLGFLDGSVAQGTGGPANTYTSNICAGNNGGGAQSSPAGLCL